MRVQRGVARGACEALVVLKADVAPSLGVFVALGEAEVYDVDDVLVLARANEEVVWLYVPVQEAVLVYEFYSLDLQRESSSVNLTICIAIISTVFSVNFLLQYSNKSSNEGPSRSITITL